MTGASDRDWRALSAILGLALVLRVVGLNQPLWYDEIITLETHLRLSWGEMLQSYSMNHHYLHNFQAKLAMELLGDAPWVLRLPAMLFGVASVWAIWLMAREVAGRHLALVAALLVALSYHHIWFSQNARGYTEMAFWGTLGTWMFLTGLGGASNARWFGYGAVLAAAVFTHLTGAFIFAAHGVLWLGWAIVRRNRGAQALRPLIGFVAGGVLTLLLYAPILPSVIASVGGVAGTSSVDVMREYQNPVWTVIEGIRTATGSVGPLVAIVGLAVLIVAFIGGIVSMRRAPLFAPFVAIHIGLTLVALMALGMRIWPRFFFADIGFIMILIVVGTRRIADWLSALTQRWIGAEGLWRLALAAMVLVSIGLAARNYVLPKQNLAGAVAYVEELGEDAGTVLAIGQGSEIFLGHFATGWRAVMNDADYLAAVAEPGPKTLVVAFPARSFRAIPAMDAESDSKLTLLTRFRGTLGDGNVLIFRRE